MEEIIKYFNESELKTRIIEKEPFFIEIATRQVLFKDSTVKNRVKIIIDHFDIIFKKLNRIFETTHENVYFCISLLKLQNLKIQFF